jgi:hypothetical protein
MVVFISDVFLGFGILAGYPVFALKPPVTPVIASSWPFSHLSKAFS